MAYEAPITIKDAIIAIQDQEYLLPSIQREFVWQPDQIITLFDSLMRDYPISTFLLWKVKSENVTKFQFYKFLKDYHERDNRHNQKSDLSGTKDIMAVLDGQQRLTSLYIGLKGSDARKLPYYQWSSDYAFPKKYLYVNLLKKLGEDSEKVYDFQFLTKDEAEGFSEERFWFRVGDILDHDDVSDTTENLIDKLEDFEENNNLEISRTAKKFARKTVNKLFNVFNKDGKISYFLEKSEELDKVLQIFIRINSGGTKLSYSDLLLSIATAQWEELDAREVIHNFVDKINSIGQRFSFNKDFVLKSSLVLADIKDIKFRVDNFSRENMQKIEKEWPEISNAILNAVRLIAHFGFDGTTLRATNAVIPIAYFLKNKNIGEEILHSGSHKENRAKIKEWLIRALLRKTFGGQPDSLYPVYRKFINEAEYTFPLDKIIERFKGHAKDLDFTVDHIEHLLTLQYGSAFTFMVLSLLYPLDNNYSFHQDHIHPKSFFYKKSLKALNITEDERVEEFRARYNALPNLQLLQATANQEKSDKVLEEWLNETMPDENLKNAYKQLHYFPLSESLAFDNFLAFYEARKQLLKTKLMQILNVKIEEPTVQ